MKRMLILPVCVAALATLPALGAAAQTSTPSVNDPSKSTGNVAKPADGSMKSKNSDDPSLTKMRKGSTSKSGMKKSHKK
ncbi:hypothetical protein ACSVBT_12935 [Afipia sp. TerB]